MIDPTKEDIGRGEPKFTSGPYTVQPVVLDGDDRGYVYIIGANLGGLVGAAHAWPTEIDSGDFSRVEANGRMLAASWELYEAVQNLLGAIDTPIARRNLGSDFSAEAIAEGRAVLAKARGEVKP